MKIDIQKDESADGSDRKKALIPPPQFQSRRAKARLLTLVCALMLVLLGMNEARKPQNWHWLTNLSGEPAEKEVAVEEFEYETLDTSNASTQTQDDTSEPDSTNPDPADSEDQSGEEKSAESFSEASNITRQEARQHSLRVRDEFWETKIYKRLNISERRHLFHVLRSLRRPEIFEPPQGDAATTQRIIEHIDRHASTADWTLLNELSVLEDDHPRRPVLERALEDFQSNWNEQIKSILQGDTKPKEEHQAMLNSIQSALDRAAYNDVYDQTPMTRAADDPAWLRAWESILYDTPVEESQRAEVTSIQLKAQPSFYRAKPVALTGELRGVEILPTRKNPLGINPFYAIWIKPNKSSISPVNAFVKELPPGIELEPNKKFTEFSKVFVKIEGTFFKIRTYEDKGNAISNSALVLAKSFKVVDRKVVEPLELGKRSDITLSRGQWIAFLVGMPLFATFLAWMAFRGTAKRRSPSEKTTSRIHGGLDDLKKNASIETVNEKLARIKDME